jgi:transposase
MEWLPEGHLAYFILEVVQTLDLSGIETAIQQKDPRGEQPYSPRLICGLLLYGYCQGVYSSRKLARATYEDVAFRVIGAGEHPHFTTINAFRLQHREALAQLFVQVLRLCQRAGLVKFGRVALDGAKIQASASKHKAMSYQRMLREEARLESEVRHLLNLGQQADEQEDRRYGVGQDRQELPGELSRREGRLQRIRQAKVQLEQEAAEARAAELREQAQAQRGKAADSTVDATERKRAATRAKLSEERAQDLDPKDQGPGAAGGASGGGLPEHRVRHHRDGSPKPAAQRNFTDPDSRIMKQGGSFVQAYNAQIIVDEAHQVILAHGVSNQGPDCQYAPPMMERLLQINPKAPQALLADSGYFSPDNVEEVEKHGIQPYLAVGREQDQNMSNGQQPATRAQQIKDRMAQKLASSEGKAIYARRKVIVEPVFGQIKEARGFRRFSLRGKQKVACEWALVCLTHNLVKLFRHRPPSIEGSFMPLRACLG